MEQNPAYRRTSSSFPLLPFYSQFKLFEFSAKRTVDWQSVIFHSGRKGYFVQLSQQIDGVFLETDLTPPLEKGFFPNEIFLGTRVILKSEKLKQSFLFKNHKLS